MDAANIIALASILVAITMPIVAGLIAAHNRSAKRIDDLERFRDAHNEWARGRDDQLQRLQKDVDGLLRRRTWDRRGNQHD